MRFSGSTIQGGSFSSETILAVWRKATPVPGLDPSVIRVDACGAKIRLLAYGSTSDPQGWEIDHLQPVAAGGSDWLFNLQPLQWQNNRHKSDNYPQWSCAVRS